MSLLVTFAEILAKTVALAGALKAVWDIIVHWIPIEQLPLVKSQTSLKEALQNRSQCQDEQLLLNNDMILNKRRMKLAKQRYLYLINNERLNQYYTEERRTGLGARFFILTGLVCMTLLTIEYLPSPTSLSDSRSGNMVFLKFSSGSLLVLICLFVIQKIDWQLSCLRGYRAFVKPFFRANEIPDEIEGSCIRPALSAFYKLTANKEISKFSDRNLLLFALSYLMLIAMVALRRCNEWLKATFHFSEVVQVEIAACLLITSYLLFTIAVILWVIVYQDKIRSVEGCLKRQFTWYNQKIDEPYLKRNGHSSINRKKSRKPVI